MTEGPIEFSLSESSDGDVVVVTLQGELDVMVASQVGQVIRRNLAEGHHQIVDLTEVTFIDSTGLAAIVKSAPNPQERARITLRRSRHHQANRLFALTGTDRLFQFESGEAEAPAAPDPARTSDSEGAGSPEGASA